MLQDSYIITENSNIAKGIYRMVLEGDTSCFTNPGQFVNVKVQGRFLRRPISVADYDDNSLTLLYKVVGAGTEQMSQMKVGEEVDLLAGLGNGFALVNAESIMLIGGGIGAAPLYGLCKELMGQAAGNKCKVVLGAATKAELFYIDEFKALGAEVLVATDDGSEGVHGFVTDAMRGTGFDYFYCCGPMPMMRAVNTLCDNIGGDVDGQFSLEERMGCGFGACMGCSIDTKKGWKRVCKDGPIFSKKDLIW